MARIKKIKTPVEYKTGKNDICTREIVYGLVTITEQNKNLPGKYCRKNKKRRKGKKNFKRTSNSR